MNTINEVLRKRENDRRQRYKRNKKALRELSVILSRTKSRFNIDEWVIIKEIYNKLEIEL